MQFLTLAHFSKYYKSYFRTLQINCDYDFIFKKSDAAIPDFLLNC